MSDSDCGFSSSEEATQLKRKNFSPNLGTKRKFVHKFRNEWLTKTEFQLWLAKSIKGDTYFSCTVCKKDYHGGISAVKKHAKAESHLSIANSRKNIIPINKNPVFHKASQLQTKSKEAEIRLSMFIIEHNIAIQTSDHLISLFKSICPESDVVKNISCNRTKATAIVCNVIGKHGSANLIERMKTNIFSIMIDESTDKSNVKHLAIVTRIVDSLSYDVKDEFAALIKVPKVSAKDIFDAIVNFFNEMNVPYKKNLVGFASDGANVMFGEHHSVKSLLEKEVPQIFVIKCLCHSLALCASYACEKIPIGVEELICEIYTYMKYSYKRQANYKEFQCFIEVKPHKLLQPSQTRWLALLACVKRVIEQFNSLKLYFQGEHFIDNHAKNIYKKLCDPTYILYLKFLEFVLPIFTNLNLEFQSQKPKIHNIYTKMSAAYKTLLDCYIKPDYLKVTDISQIQYRNPNNFL